MDGIERVNSVRQHYNDDVPSFVIDNVSDIDTESAGTEPYLNAFDNKVNIFAGMIISREKLQNHQYKWALTRFLDSKYFGCD